MEREKREGGERKEGRERGKGKGREEGREGGMKGGRKEGRKTKEVSYHYNLSDIIPDSSRQQQLFDIYRCCIRSFELLMMDGKTVRNM